MAIAQPIHSMTSSLTVKGLLLWGLQALGVLAWLAQLVIDGSEANLVSATLVLASSSLLLQYLRVSDAMTTNPVSSFALLGFTLSSQFIALIAQSADLAPFVQHLRAPILTFTVLGTVHVVAVLTHFVHRHFQPFSNSSKFIAEKVYAPLNLHRIPVPEMLWIFGLVGMLAYVFGGGAAGDVGGKFLAGFIYYMWAPFLIPLYLNVVGNSYCTPTRQYPALFAYMSLIIVIALIKNYRATLFMAPIQVFFLFVMHQCRSAEPVSKLFIKRLLIIATLGLVALAPLADMVTAMEIARANRGKATALEMMENTAQAFMDKQKLQAHRDEGLLTQMLKPYDERYLSNPLLGRFTETKFHDNMLHFGSLFGDDERERLIRDQFNKMIAIVPQNILDFLEIKFNKDEYFYSSGDFYLSLSHGASLGGFATGSIWADLYVIFGWGFPIVVFMMLTPVFIIMDALSRFSPGMYITPASMCAMWHLFLYGIGGDSIAGKVNQLTRGSIQQVVLYALLVFGVATLLQLFRKKAFVQPDEAILPSNSGALVQPP